MRIYALAAFLLSLVAPAAAQEVNLYTARHYDTDASLYTEFTDQTEIEVNVIEGESDQLIERIVREGEFSPADLLMTVDAGRIWRADEAEVFQSVQSDVLQARVPAHLRHPDGYWFALSKRARVIVYNKAAGRPDGLNDYEDLADPRFRDQICIRSSSNIYNISLMASMISHHGEQGAEEWARGVVANFARPPQGNDRAQIEGVAAGQCGLGVANSYYIGRYIGSNDPAQRAIYDAIGVIFPNQDDRGTHVNMSGAGVLKHAPNAENAIRFLEYLTSESAQRIFAEGNNEYPVANGMTATGPVSELGQFNEDTLNARELGVHQASAVRVFDRAGWN